MLERLLILIVLFAVAYLAYRLFVRYQLRNAAHTSDPILRGLRPGVPTIVYFTTPGCIPCRTLQQPTLQRLREQLAELQIIQIDASTAPDVAERWRVMSAPTTFVLDKNLRPHSVNNGTADEQTLKRQIEMAFS